MYAEFNFTFVPNETSNINEATYQTSSYIVMHILELNLKAMEKYILHVLCFSQK